MTRHRLVAALVVLVAVLCAPATAWALISTTGIKQTNSIAAATLAAPTAFTATQVHYTRVRLSWTAPSGYTPTSVSLTQSTGTLAGCTATAPTNPCTATGLSPYTTYTWTLTYHYHGWKAQVVVTKKTLAHIVMTNANCTIEITNTNTDVITTGCSISTEGTLNSLTLYRPTLPATHTGDVLIAQFGSRHKTPPGVTAPSGWTKITSASSNGTGYTNFAYTYYCVISATSACKPTVTSWTWSWTATATTSKNASGGILLFSGVTPTTPFNAGAAKANAPSSWTKATLPGVTPTQYDSQVVSFLDSGGKQLFHGNGTCKIASGTVKKHYTNQNKNTAHSTYIHDSTVCVPAAPDATETASPAQSFTLSAAGTNTFAWVAVTVSLNPK